LKRKENDVQDCSKLRCVEIVGSSTRPRQKQTTTIVSDRNRIHFPPRSTLSSKPPQLQILDLKYTLPTRPLYVSYNVVVWFGTMSCEMNEGDCCECLLTEEDEGGRQKVSL